MRTIIIAGFVLALACGMFLNYAGHPGQALAQGNNTKNATQGSAGGGAAASNATKSSGASSAGGGAGGKSTTPPSTVATMKGGPKAAGSASQLQQIEGPNATKIMSSNTPVGNKPGIKGLASEANTTSASKPTGGAAKNATSAAGSAANKTSAGAGGAAQNATNATQGQNKTSSNPLAKIPVIGKLFGGK